VISGLFYSIRLAQAGFVLARHGVFALVDPQPLPPLARLGLRLARLLERPASASNPHRLSTALTALGPNYVKLGQFLATRPDVVGPALARDLESLQDKMPPFAQAEAERIVETALGKPLNTVFVGFGPAVAAASIAQVHRAEIAQNDARRAVAVKILRPGIERRFKSDLNAFYFVARKTEAMSAEARRLRMVEVVDTLARSVAIEMDLRLEAAALSEMAENSKDDADFRVPSVYWDLTAKDVLTLEWMEGTPLSDRAALIEKGFDLPALGRAVIQNFLRHAMRDGFFHADMHPGNLFVDAEGKIVAVDFYAFITRDYLLAAQVHFNAGYVPPQHSVESFAQAIRAIGEPIHNRTAEEISMAKLLTLLFEVTAIFDMQTRPELILLQKTMVVVEGVARGLDPRLDMWKTAEPVVREWIERNLGPLGRLEDIAGGAKDIGRFLGQVPGLLTRVARVADQLDAVSREGIVLAPETIAAIGQAEGRANRWSAAALWAIAALLLYLVYLVS
jgi:ubiquinone biosynthesis protein